VDLKLIFDLAKQWDFDHIQLAKYLASESSNNHFTHNEVIKLKSASIWPKEM